MCKQTDGVAMGSPSQLWAMGYVLWAMCISTTTGSHQATCSTMVKTAIDSSTLISTTQIVQTNRHQTGL